jgi:MoxR-like ATPase
MKEQFKPVETLSAFRPEDADRLGEIERTREELLSSANIPDEVKEMLRQMDIKSKAEEVGTFLESRGKERETITSEEGGKEVRIGREKTPVFEGAKDEPLSWDIVTNQFREQGQTMVDISFKRSDGLEIQPGGNPVEGKVRLEDKDRFIPMEEFKALKGEKASYLAAVENLRSDDQTKKEEAEMYLGKLKKEHPNSEWTLRALRHLNGLATKESEDVLGRDPYFVETPHVVETMEKFTRLVNRQRERDQGIVILEGDAGTGKNKIVDHLAYLTHRPIFRFTCSAGKDEQDLKYLLEYDSKKGTYRINSTVVEALETPGAILEFDEINTLKPEVAKILNSLFDHDRALFLGEDKKVVKAADEVLLVGLQNPQHYMGVKPLAETIKSRARIMEVTYPPFEKEGGSPNESKQYRADEAMILRQYVAELKDLDPKEFQLVWDNVVNGKTDPRAADLLTTIRKEKIEDVKEIVSIANKIREAYRAYHEGKSDDPIKFVFSLRESVEAAYEIADVELTEKEKQQGMTRAKKAVQEVIIPKIPVGEERTYLSTLIAEL